MQLYLIRHGQSTNNHLYATTGAEDGRSFDPELTELGVRQAEHLAAFLAGKPAQAACSVAALASLFQAPAPTGGRGLLGLSHLYTSPMTRTVRTGLPAARALGLPLVAWKDLHEGGGLYLEVAEGEMEGQPGLDRAAMERRFPELVWPPELGDGPWWNRSFEEKEERMPRARRVLHELLQRHPGGTPDRVAFFTHAAFTNYFLGAVLGSGEWRPPAWFGMFNCSLTRLDFRAEGEPSVVFTDYTGHLPAELISG